MKNEIDIDECIVYFLLGLTGLIFIWRPIHEIINKSKIKNGK